jgi:cell wall-associated NlpC family hydrolase
VRLAFLRRTASVGLLSCLAGTPVLGQGVGVSAGWYLTEPDGWLDLSVGFSRKLTGPIGLTFLGTWLNPAERSDGDLIGVGADLTISQGGSPGPYLVGGLSGGVGLHGTDALWGSWSAGAGYEFLVLGSVRLGFEGRWRELTIGDDGSPEVALRLGFGGGGRSSSSPAPAAQATPPPIAGAPVLAATTADPAPIEVDDSASPVPGASGTALALGIVSTAREVMGTPYRWGGQGKNGEGFDCSGLIQYSFGQHGISLPRTSAEQAREGVAVERRLESLAPGDILTFSNTRDRKRITHVGLYVGDGEFIHSATKGVQLSRLSADDPYGRWWWNRWVGARRVAGGTPP